MKRRLLASILIVVFTLHLSTIEAKEPVKQQVFDKEFFIPVVIPTPLPVVTVEIFAVETPTPQPTSTPKPTPKPTKKPITVESARNYALDKIGKAQFKCLDILFEMESSWNTFATNKSSGAYGIPQALPGYKMQKADPDWKTNPVTQVKWGLMYINGRYGSACNALDHFYSYGWY